MFPAPNHLKGISVCQFPQAAVSHLRALQHLMPLSVLQFTLLTANWANALKHIAIVEPIKEIVVQTVKLTHGPLQSKIYMH